MSSNETNLHFKPCPRCGQDAYAHPHYTHWCPHCLWNVYPDNEEWNHPDDSMKQKMEKYMEKGIALYRTLASHKIGEKPPLTWEFYLAHVVAFLVHLFVLLLFLLGVSLLWESRHGWGLLIPGVLVLSLAIFFRPRLVSWPCEGVATPEQTPLLYEMVDDIAEAMTLPPVDGILITADVNAGIVQAGWRQRRLLVLGLPLWMLLSTEERIALIAHELAHDAHDDYKRSVMVVSAKGSLEQMKRFLDFSGFGCLALLLMFPVAILLFGLDFLLSRLRQRSEFLADLTAAYVAGTGAALSNRQKTFSGYFFDAALDKVVLQKREERLLTFWQELLQEVPAQEWERLEWVELIDNVQQNSFHPAKQLLETFLAENKFPQPLLRPSSWDKEEMDEELEESMVWLEEQLVEGRRPYGIRRR